MAVDRRVRNSRSSNNRVPRVRTCPSRGGWARARQPVQDPESGPAVAQRERRDRRPRWSNFTAAPWPGMFRNCSSPKRTRSWRIGLPRGNQHRSDPGQKRSLGDACRAIARSHRAEGGDRQHECSAGGRQRRDGYPVGHRPGEVSSPARSSDVACDTGRVRPAPATALELLDVDGLGALGPGLLLV